jgi:ornithine decarboxylase
MDNVNFDNTQQFYSKVYKGELGGLSEGRNAALYGMTCDGLDVISRSLAMPTEVRIGDWLCFGGMGAYTFGVKTTFNGMTATDEICRLEEPTAVELPIDQPAIPLPYPQ